MQNNITFLCLGANLGDCIAQLAQARGLISQQIGDIVSSSAIYKTSPWGVENQPDYYNQMLKVQTLLTPDQLLYATLAIEQKMGRLRTHTWAARTIDIDILYYNDLIINTEALQIPHPRLHLRKFVLEPLRHIAADYQHPLFILNHEQLLAACDDLSTVEKVLV